MIGELGQLVLCFALVSGLVSSGMMSLARYRLHGQAITHVVSTATGSAP